MQSSINHCSKTEMIANDGTNVILSTDKVLQNNRKLLVKRTYQKAMVDVDEC